MIRSQFYAPQDSVWVKADYSQQEPRALIHFACEYELEDAFKIRRMYLDDSNLDLYKVIADLCHASGYSFIARSDAKILLLAAQYGMGAKKLAELMGFRYTAEVGAIDLKNFRNKEFTRCRYLSEEELLPLALEDVALEKARTLLKAFHSTFPFIKDMERILIRQVNKHGYITTIGKRKIYIEKDFAYKALNYLVQGSCADITKKGMIGCYKENILPVLQVHDELDFIFANDDKLQSNIRTVKHEMENTFDIHVPMLVDIEVGKNWGELERQ
jgi:DNA polymerase I-like protein with 3'-5' exonuclease and polymerase domains